MLDESGELCVVLCAVPVLLGIVLVSAGQSVARGLRRLLRRRPADTQRHVTRA